MTFLLDTNVISEMMMPLPDPGVMAWMTANQDECSLSAITLAEMARGVEALADGKRKNELTKRLAFLQEDYSDRILPVDEIVSWEWARYVNRIKAAGHAISVMDSLIAATALASRLTVVTRNTGDFLDVPTLNPFSSAESP